MIQKKKHGRMLWLAGFEMRKSFLTLPVLIALAAALILNAVVIGSQSSYLDELDGARIVYKRLYQEYAGEISEEKIKNLLALYRPLQKAENDLTIGDVYDPDSWFGRYGADGFFLERTFVREMQYDYLYQNYAYNVATQAESKMDRMQKQSSQYEYRKQKRIAEDYKGRKITSFVYRKQKRIAEDYKGRKITSFVYTEMIDLWYRYSFSSIIMVLLVIFSVSGVFAIEWETDMRMILIPSVGGRKQTVTAKLVASMFFSIIIGFLFCLEDVIVVIVRSGGISVLRQPLYSIPVYQNAPLRMNIATFFLLDGAMKICGLCGLCLLVLMVSRCLHSVMASFISGVAIIILCYLLLAKTPCSFSFRVWNPLAFLFLNEFFLEEQFVCVLDYPVRMPFAVWLGQIGIILIGCGVFVFVRKGRKC